MGILNPITNPIRFGAHVASGTVGRAFSGVGGYFSASSNLAGLMFQMKSFEAKDFFDSKKLRRYLKEYHRAKKRLFRYGGEKKGNTFLPTYIQKKVYDKYKNNPDLLNRVLEHEVGVFVGEFEQFWQVVSSIDLEEKDMELQKNAALIRDEEEMIALINKIPETKDTVMMRDDFNNFKKEAKRLVKKEKKADISEFRWLQRLSLHSKRVVGGFAGFFGKNFYSLSYLSHKISKFTKRIYTREMRKFDSEFSSLQEEINRQKVTPATISRLRFLLKNYEKIRKYYHEIDKDLALVTQKMFHEFDIVMNECVVPFYAAIKHIRGADRILKIDNKLKQIYQDYVANIQAEEFEVRKVYAQLNKFVNACKRAFAEVQRANSQVMDNLQSKMAVTAPKLSPST